VQFAYRLVQSVPRKVFTSGDSSTLAEAGIENMTMLMMERCDELK
jgi:hypothetical protein